ncbi:MAG: ABC transporter ATP-binding protein [Marinosulfonomonas sp.]|nr:ABC transporter ATP-binding protein [Marinosulfonomonas sp.]
MSDFVLLENLTLAYGKTIAVEALNLSINQGELITLLGPSGCGKTTTMRAIAGLMPLRGGKVWIDGQDVSRIPPSKRQVGLVFQSYALFPHLSVFENVAFGLRLRSEPNLKQAVMDGLEMVGLAEFADRHPTDLSGGQQQRVALARSVVMKPKVLLLDEPLSNLDARLRLDMRTELQRLQKDTGITMVFVTHDQSEALALADKIVLMRDGAIEQIGTPEQIYSAPVSGFAADFVGFETILPDGKGGGQAWRPGAVVLGQGPYNGTVRGASFAGERREYVLDSKIGVVKADVSVAHPAFEIGQTVDFDLPPETAVQLARVD